MPRTPRAPMVFLAVFCWISLLVLPVLAEMKPMGDRAMSSVSGREGLNMVLQDFRVSGNQTLYYKQDEFADEGLLLSDLSVDNGSGAGVTIGSTANPITFDIEGAKGGRWIIEFPDSDIDQTDVEIGNAWVATSGFASSNRQKIADEISITNAEWAGGTRFEFGTNPGGGLQVGLGIVLNGDIRLEAPGYSYVDLNQIGGFASCSNGYTNFDIDTDCSGVLNWASLSDDRPLEINFDGTNNAISIDYKVPSTSSPTAGQIVVESSYIYDGSNYIPTGEIWTDQIRIGQLNIETPYTPDDGHTYDRPNSTVTR